MIDAKAFLVDLKALEEDIRKETGQAMKHAVEEALRHAHTTSLFQDRTGALRGSLQGWYLDHQGEIRNVAKYAKFVEAGTLAHPITGRPWLQFYWEKVGAWVKFRQVQHPGTKPRPFMEKAGEWGGAVLFDALSAFTDDAIRKFNAK